MSAFTQSVILQVGINVLLAVGYWIAVSTGRYSFGHVGFVAIGAYTSSILTENFSWPLPSALLAAAAAATVGGVLVGFMALRLPMLYLAIITLAFSSVIVIIANEWDYVGGPIGMFGMDGTSIPLVFTCLAIVVVYLLLLSRSRLGLAYSAIREDDQAARASGIRVTRVAVSAFATSAAVTGVAGGLIAHQQGVIQPEQFGPQASLLVDPVRGAGRRPVFLGSGPRGHRSHAVADLSELVGRLVPDRLRPPVHRAHDCPAPRSDRAPQRQFPYG